MTCKDCIHFEVCREFLSYIAEMRKDDIPTPSDDAERCKRFKDRSRFVELPYPISEGMKLCYIFEDESDRMRVGEDREVVTRVCKDGFYVSGRLDSDGTYHYDDDFFPWDAIGAEYFFTLEEAEQALKERETK